MIVFAVMRSAQSHSQLIGLYETEAYAELVANDTNLTYPSWARAKVVPLTVRKDPGKS